MAELARHAFLHELVLSTLLGLAVYTVCALVILAAERRQQRDMSAYRTPNLLNDLAYVVFYQCSIYNILASPLFASIVPRLKFLRIGLLLNLSPVASLLVCWLIFDFLNGNYGRILSLWDVLFGTLVRSEQPARRFGVDGMVVPERLTAQFAHPFRVSPAGRCSPDSGRRFRETHSRDRYLLLRLFVGHPVRRTKAWRQRNMRMLSRFAVLALLMGLFVVPATEARTRVFVRIGPPPIVVERPMLAPAPEFVWQPGYHMWNGNSYVWVRGAWVRPPHRHARWVTGRWVHERRGYYWSDGRWNR
jgi:hypothetical protein